MSHRTARFAVQALKDRGMFAIDGEHFHAMFARFVHDSLAGHDQDFFRSDGDVFAGANRRERGLQSGRPNNRDQHDFRLRQSGELNKPSSPE